MRPPGFLLDVDGPIASPETRTVAIPSILDDLLALATAGAPIAFITGRSSDFIDREVVGPLVARGLADALRAGGAGMYGVFEKGGAWAPIWGGGLGVVEVDRSVAFPDEVVAAVRALVETQFADTMFFDATKRAMISVEQHPGVPSDAYRLAQTRFDDRVFDLVANAGLGIRHGAREHRDSRGQVPFRIDPTIISTDVESVLLDKDHGAERALEHLAAFGPLPERWVTAGDSRSDYLMADHLHARSFDVEHVDVRPSDGVLPRAYPVRIEGDLIHDVAGAAMLAREAGAVRP